MKHGSMTSRGDREVIIYGHRECQRKCQTHSVRQHTWYNSVMCWSASVYLLRLGFLAKLVNQKSSSSVRQSFYNPSERSSFQLIVRPLVIICGALELYAESAYEATVRTICSNYSTICLFQTIRTRWFWRPQACAD